MKYPKTNPIGIDAAIHKLQAYLYDKLKATWGLTDERLTAYPRVYRNQGNGGYEPQFKFQGANESEIEYLPVFADDRVDAMFFFGVAENTTITDGNDNEVKAHIIFHVNLETLTTTKDLLHRGDNEAITDVYNLLTKRQFGFQPEGWVTGLDRVFVEYDGWRTANLKNMAPWLYFRFNLNLRYNPNQCLRTPITVITGLSCND